MMAFMTGGLLGARCLLLTCAITPGAAFATCGEECDQQYSSDVDDCHSNYGDDPADAGDLASCIQDARVNYGSCLDDCARPVVLSSFVGAGQSRAVSLLLHDISALGAFQRAYHQTEELRRLPEPAHQ